jgi:hypothetical protein
VECEREDQEEIVLRRTSERTPEKKPKSRGDTENLKCTAELTGKLEGISA